MVHFLKIKVFTFAFAKVLLIFVYSLLDSEVDQM